jgi:hypothetical protein
MDYAMALCIEEEKKKCLDVIQTYYKKNKHPSILRLRDYLQSLSVQDPTVIEDLEKIKIYLSTDLSESSFTESCFTPGEAKHESFAKDA